MKNLLSPSNNGKLCWKLKPFYRSPFRLLFIYIYIISYYCRSSAGRQFECVERAFRWTLSYVFVNIVIEIFQNLCSLMEVMGDVDDLSFFNTQGAGPGPRCWSKMLNNHGAARSPCTSLKTVVIADSFCNSVHWSIHGVSTTMPRLCIVVLTTV